MNYAPIKDSRQLEHLYKQIRVTSNCCMRIHRCLTGREDSDQTSFIGSTLYMSQGMRNQENILTSRLGQPVCRQSFQMLCSRFSVYYCFLSYLMWFLKAVIRLHGGQSDLRLCLSSMPAARFCHT